MSGEDRSFWSSPIPLWDVALILAVAIAAPLLAVAGHLWIGIALCCCLGCFGLGLVVGRRMRD